VRPVRHRRRPARRRTNLSTSAEGFRRPYDTLYGTEAARAASLHRDFDALREHIDYLPDTLVWNIEPQTVHVVSGTRYRQLAFDALIVCSGATDRLMPVRGWHLAGTYSLGGAQVALKSQGCAIGARTVMMARGRFCISSPRST